MFKEDATTSGNNRNQCLKKTQQQVATIEINV